MSSAADRPVYRTRPLPVGDLNGEYLLAPSLLDVTRQELIRFALSGIRDGGHEGLVFWGGWESGEGTVLTTVIRPEVDHSYGRVRVSARGYGVAARRARAMGILLIAQVHSHPGDDARHSDGDDEMVGLPTEGMLSVVVPNFGIGLSQPTDAAVHQFQDGRWVLCSQESVARQVVSAPSLLETRP